MHQHTHNGSTRKKGDKVAEKNIQGSMAENFPNLLKNINLYIEVAHTHKKTQTNKQTKKPSKDDKHKEIHKQKQ